MTGSDDRFWREQERRHEQLEQPCCTQSSMCWALTDLAGDLAVVIHGEADCANSFFRHLGRSTSQYFSTRLSERQLVTGATARPLRRLLERIAVERRPEAVLVLGTCPVELIGDPFEQVVADVAREVEIPMRALRTHGLALMSQTRCQDWLASELARLAEPGAQQERAVNLIGLPRFADLDEVVELLGAAGIRLNGSYPNGTSLAAWRRVGRAAVSFVVDPPMFPSLLERLAEAGQPVVEVPLPIGPAATAELYRIVAARFGARTALEGALEPRLAQLQPAMERLAARARGRRLAICVRMSKTHRTDRLAHDGLGELPLLRSLGFEVGLLVQGPPEQAPRQRFADRLAELGHGDVPFDVFEGPWRLGQRLREGGYEIALMSDVAQNVVEEAGIRMIPAGALRPLLSGMPDNLRLIAQVLEEGP